MSYWKKPSSYGIDDAMADTRARSVPVRKSYTIQDELADTRARSRTDAQMRPRITTALGGAPGAAKKPLSIAERARLRIASIYDPVLKQITDQINQQAKTQQDTIFGYSRQLAGDMGKYVGSFGDIYAGAQRSQAAADAATAQRLEGGGNKLAGELATKLGAMGAPGNVQSEISGQAAATGTGAANAAYARGSSDLTRLIAQGATEQTFAAKQPGFVLQRGQQDITNVGRQAASDIQSETSALRAKIPGDTADLIDQMTATAEEKAAARAKARQDRADRAWEAATLKVAYGMPLTPADRRALNSGYGSNPDAVKASAKNRNVKLTIRQVGDRVVAIDPVTGKTVRDIGAAPTGAQSNVKTVTVDGRVWVIDPKTGEKLRDLGKAGTPGSKKKAQLHFVTIGGWIWGVDPYTGKKVVRVGKAPSKKGSGTPGAGDIATGTTP